MGEFLLRTFGFITILMWWILAPIYALIAWCQGQSGSKISAPSKTVCGKGNSDEGSTSSDILHWSATEIARKIRRSELTSLEAVQAFCDRCNDVDCLLKAIVENRFKEAAEEAEKVDQLIRSGQKSVEQIEADTPLLGVPITVKESCQCLGMSCSTGSLLRKGSKASKDCEAVSLLKKAGAIPICVTSTPEQCCSVETYNFITGYTCNPYDFSRTAGGSSGGEAALISSLASPLGVGSDFLGSIRVPSLFCGIFGHKPSAKIVSNKGHSVYMDNENFDNMLTIGPMARNACDLKLALNIMAGEKAHLLDLNTKVDLSKLNIYVLDPRSGLCEISVNGDIKNSIRKAVKYLESTFHCETQKIHIPELDQCFQLLGMQLTYVKNLNSTLRLKDPKDESSTFIELLKSLVFCSKYTLQTVLSRAIIELIGLYSKEKRLKYYELKDELKERIESILGDDGVMMMPTYPITAFRRYNYAWTVTGLRFPALANMFGFPATHIPTGVNDNGMPCGFQVMASTNNDRLTLAVAEELEKAFGGSASPK